MLLKQLWSLDSGVKRTLPWLSLRAGKTSHRKVMSDQSCVTCPSRHLLILLTLMLAMILPVDGASSFSREEARVLREGLSRVFGIEEPRYVKESLKDQNRFSKDAHERARRSSKKHSPRELHASCKAYNLTVSLTDLGWENFIVAPKTISIGYCAGHCQFPLAMPHSRVSETGESKYPVTHHALFQAFSSVPELNLGSLAPTPSCAAVRYDRPMTVVVYSTFPGVTRRKMYRNLMIADCGCVWKVSQLQSERMNKNAVTAINALIAAWGWTLLIFCFSSGFCKRWRAGEKKRAERREDEPMRTWTERKNQ